MSKRHVLRWFWGTLAACASCWAASPAELSAQGYRLHRVASDLAQPVFMTQAPGDPANILYYATRITAAPGTGGGSGTHDMGSIWRYDLTTRTSTEILDLSSRTLTLDGGISGFAFSPDFNTMGSPGYQKMYVSTSTRQGAGLAPIDRVEEFLTTGPNGTVPVDGGGLPLINRTILQYTHQNTVQNHTIDWIGFDPTTASQAVGSPDRNHLYIVTGDGCNGCDSHLRPEQKANAIEGKLLRVDVDASHADAYPSGDTFALTRNYAIPTTNPIPLWNAAHPGDELTGTTLTYSSGATPVTYGPPVFEEIYATGVRNTFGAGFDRQTGDWYGGDVGENAREEVNFLKADPYDGSQAPLDYGYIQREGTIGGGFGSSPSTTLQWNLAGGGTEIVDSVNPIREGRHATLNSGSTSGTDEIRSTGRSAYIGGYVYRGPVEELQGKYFYTDFVHGNIFSLEFDRDTPLASYSGGNLNLNDDPAEGELDVAALGHRELVLNRNLNSLWQSLIADPTDPNYTAANFGTQFGVGRVVNFGEDNAGNLYILDMGGPRGCTDFVCDYAAAGLGEIFMIVPTMDVRVTVNRDTGELTFSNDTGIAVDIRGYRLSSLAAGSIDPAALTPVTNRLDASMDGDGSIDPVNEWEITSAGGDQSEFSEAAVGGGQTSLSIDEQFTLSPSGGWIQSIYEDLQLEVTLGDGTIGFAEVTFVGNGDQPFDRSDLNFNGGLDGEDWNIFLANHLGVEGGLTLAESYQLGDLDGDGDNDFFDFRIFQADYIDANGEAAFLALFGVPEPGTLTLLVAACCGLTLVRRRARSTQRLSALRGRVQWPHGISRTAAAAVAAWLILQAQSEAVLVRQYTFNGLTVEDMIGGPGAADGTLFGNATMSLGVLDLPGNSGDYAELPGPTINLNSFTDATFEAWFEWDGGGAWQRVFDFGTTTGTGGGQDYVFYTPNIGSSLPGTMRAVISNAGGGTAERQASSAPSPSQGGFHHLAVVIDDGANGGPDTISLYFDNVLRASNTLLDRTLSGVSNDSAWLGRSLYTSSSDAFFNGKIDEFRLYNHALSSTEVANNFAAGPVPFQAIELNVNTFTGEVEIVNQANLPLAIDYYRVTSAGGALSPSTWNSLDDQNVDADGLDTGQNWDEGGNPDANEVTELYMRGASNIAAAGTRSLGQLFDPLVFGKRVDGDLVFQFALQGGAELQTGMVNYFAPPPLLGDYNDDGYVNAADYTVYRNCKAGLDGCTTLTNDAGAAGVTIDDYNYWKAHYGETLFGSGASAGGQQAPEPTTGMLFVAGVLASLCGGFVTRRQRVPA